MSKRVGTPEMEDGGWTIEFLEENAFIAIRRLEADAKKSQPYQPLARTGWCRFSLAVLLLPIRIGPTQLRMAQLALIPLRFPENRQLGHLRRHPLNY
jgi:hypothetical protein